MTPEEKLKTKIKILEKELFTPKNKKERKFAEFVAEMRKNLFKI